MTITAVRRVLALAVLAGLASGCAGQGGSTGSRRPGAGVLSVLSGLPTPAAGTQLVACPSLGTPDVTVVVPLPAGPVSGSARPGRCTFHHGGDETLVQFGVRRTLADYYEHDVEPYVATGGGGDDDEGDDSIYDANLNDHATIFGARSGELLTFAPYEDGSPHREFRAQAAGVRLSVFTPTTSGNANPTLPPALARRFARTASAVRVLPGRRGICPAAGSRLVALSLPSSTAEMTVGRSGCTFSGSDGRISLAPMSAATIEQQRRAVRITGFSRERENAIRSSVAFGR